MAQPYSSPAAVPPGLEYLSQVSVTFGNNTVRPESVVLVHNYRE